MMQDDPYLDSDVVFGMRSSLIAGFIKCESAEEAARYQVTVPFYIVRYDSY